MSTQLDELFLRQAAGDECEVDSYSDLLEAIVQHCPDASVEYESQQWSRLAAIHQGDCIIYEPDELRGDALPFNPEEIAVQVTYCWDDENNCWDLAWVATWPLD